MVVKYAAHRGFKSQFPENTLPAFKAAYEAQCQVIETDLHITSDDEIVIAHDIDTNRVFGEDYVITETAWKGKLDQLLTLREPRSPIPLFDDVLTWVIEVWDNGGQIKLMLDIKPDNNPKQLYELIWKIFEQKRGVDYWKDKIIWGLWNSSFILPEFIMGWEIINITFDVHVAIEFNKACIEKDVKLYAVSIFGMIIYNNVEALKLLSWAKDYEIKIWFWTLNNHNEVLKAIDFTENGTLLEGVVTDDPPAAMGKTVNEGNKITFSYNFNWWVKKQLYSAFLFLSRRRYNITPLFRILQKIGFI